MLEAVHRIRASQLDLSWQMVLPDERAATLAHTFALPDCLHVQIGGLDRALAKAELAIASTGTVTLECAYFGVPTVAIYKTSRLSYLVGKQLVRVRYLAMPNLLAGEEVYPEFIQDAATGENIARAALDLLQNPKVRARLERVLERIVRSLGMPGASARAADLLADLLESAPRPIRAWLGHS
jgi:lipid-A-disaccharide synthase